MAAERRSPDASPFGFVTFGTGNGVPGVAPARTNDSRTPDPELVLAGTPDGYVTEVDGQRVDGAVQGSIFATYMHYRFWRATRSLPTCLSPWLPGIRFRHWMCRGG